jgi:hypothetical protein
VLLPVGRLAFEALDPFGTGRRRDRFVSVGREEVGQDHAVDRIVLDHQDLLHAQAA